MEISSNMASVMFVIRRHQDHEVMHQDIHCLFLVTTDCLDQLDKISNDFSSDLQGISLIKSRVKELGHFVRFIL